MTFYVYGLIDPNTTDCRYVGKTNNPKDRFKKHIKDLREDYKSRWIRTLLATEQVPIMVELESFPTDAECQIGEKWWIAYFREIGCPLTNATDGGDGASAGHLVSAETRAKIGVANSGRPQSPESIEKRAAQLRGRKLPQSQCDNMSRSMTGRVITPTHREKLSVAGMGHAVTPETRLKISKAGKGRIPSPEARANMAAGQKARREREAANG